MKRILMIGMALLILLCGCTQINETSDHSTMLEQNTREDGSISSVEEPTAEVVIENGILIAENLSPFTGRYWEDESGKEVKNVCAFRFTNNADFVLKNGEIILNSGNNEVSFHLSMIPVGGSAVVIATDGVTVESNQFLYVDSYLEFEEELEDLSSMLKMTPSGKDQLTIENISGDVLGAFTVYYGPIDENGERMIGNAFTYEIGGMGIGEQMTVLPPNWQSGSCVFSVYALKE